MINLMAGLLVRTRLLVVLKTLKLVPGIYNRLSGFTNVNLDYLLGILTSGSTPLV